jgi:haloacid dehalogenase superfamily, subfamily IA, variant 3 with third motif having DD or ED/haloacid dehalogenase superfamily, subfamily IA, variant 1 with third motif having Dx(3-4)D or Dx(3-4)E
MTTPLFPHRSALHAVLLDIDGTLIDSNDAHARAWVAALAQHGYVVPFTEVRPLIGMGGDKMLPQLTGLDPESGEADRISETRAEMFRRELPSIKPTRGSRELLQLLTDQGLELVVATSAQSQEVQAALEQAGVADLIETRASSGDAERSKPDPDIVQAALRKSGNTAAHCIMIGDTPYDIEAAKRARVPCIALRCGGLWDDKSLGDAVAIYDNPGDLAAQFASSPLAAVS